MSHIVRPRTSENRSQGVIVSISLNPGRPRSADSIIQDSSCSWSQSGHTGPLKLHTCRSCVSRGTRAESTVPDPVNQGHKSSWESSLGMQTTSQQQTCTTNCDQLIRVCV